MQQREVEIVREEVRQVVGYLRANFPDLEDDEQTWIDTIEGESSLLEVAAKVVDRIGEVEAMSDTLKTRIGGLMIRKGRFDTQAEALRGALVILMGEAALTKLELPEATISLRHIAPKLIVTDPEAVPDELCTFTKKPKLADIRTAAEQSGKPIPGTTLDNGRSSVTIRRM